MAIPADVAAGDQALAAKINEIIDAIEYNREIFSPAMVGGTADRSHMGVLVDGAGDVADMIIKVPQGFTSIVDLEVIFTPNATGANMHLDITTYFGQYDGAEDHNVHSETENARDIGATVNIQNLAHDISDLVTGLAAGDVLAVKVAYDATAVATNAYVRGLRFKWA